ncbi:MAG: Ig-like domain-containing protein, partial [Trueperaceae bacterium]|nr:Ig-like domain-containing protein [Trueperaceae bacterium]
MNGQWMKALGPTVLLALALVACGGGTSPTASVTGVSVTLATSEIAVDGSTTASATVQGSVGVSQAVTWSSSDPSVATVASSGLVTGVGGGVADIIATSTVDVTKSGSARITVVEDEVTADCSTTTPLSGNIVTDTTLGLDCYSVTGFVNIQDGATLTIPAGAVLRFANTSGLRVQVDGALVASGTAVNPIVLTSTSSIAGSWLGVYIRSNDPTNTLRNVVVAYAGERNFSFHGSNTIGAGVRIASGARASISDSTFRGNETTGVYLDGGATVTGFADNAFDGNAGTPMLVSSNQLGMLDAESDYAGAGVGLTGNADNHIGVRSSTVSTAQSWPAANAPYRLSGFTDIDGASAAVTVAPGAIFEGTNGSGIRVRNDASFNATGTPGNGILFRGISVVAGTWLGLYFESNSPSNALDHVTVEA